jgi:hypothetical protein
MVEENGMSQEEEEPIYKLVKDLTEEVKSKATLIYGFPNEVTITSAELLLGPDGWGGKVYYLEIEYEVDGVQCEEMRSIWANLTSVVDDMLFEIKDSYERTHFIK